MQGLLALGPLVGSSGSICLCYACAGSDPARGSSMRAARRSTTLRCASTSHSASRPPSDERAPPSKRAMIGLPATGDRPCRCSVTSYQSWRVWRPETAGFFLGGAQPNPTADQRFAPCPPTLTSFPARRSSNCRVRKRRDR